MRKLIIILLLIFVLEGVVVAMDYYHSNASPSRSLEMNKGQIDALLEKYSKQLNVNVRTGTK